MLVLALSVAANGWLSAAHCAAASFKPRHRELHAQQGVAIFPRRTAPRLHSSTEKLTGCGTAYAPFRGAQRRGFIQAASPRRCRCRSTCTFPQRTAPRLHSSHQPPAFFIAGAGTFPRRSAPRLHSSMPSCTGAPGGKTTFRGAERRGFISSQAGNGPIMTPARCWIFPGALRRGFIQAPDPSLLLQAQPRGQRFPRRSAPRLTPWSPRDTWRSPASAGPQRFVEAGQGQARRHVAG